MADTKFAINVQFEGTTDKEKPENTTLYAFDAKGKLLGSAPVDKGQVTLSLPAESTTQAVRFFMGPSLDEGTEASVALVSRLGASEERLKLDPKNPKIQLRIPGPIWKRWPLCHCVVRGRVIKRQPQPDGTVRDLPICNSRVFIYEVDVLPNIILRLPDPIVVRLRDELIREVTRPIRPIPIPKPFPGGLRPEPAEDSDSPVASIALPDTATQLRVRALAQTTSISHIRQSLADLHLIIRPYLCLWPWLFPFFHTRRDLLRVVNVDENGNFVTVIPYLCIGDRPDLYFRVEQLQGGVWKTIYDPPLACHVYWNYQCGTEIIINITDPSAIACVPQDPVVTGETTWVMPYSVGGTRIWGTPPPGSPATPDGWVRSDGFTDYGVYRNAPFGATLAFRMGYSNDITTSTTIEYYRWSYRKGTTGDWTQMNIPVSRHYVKQVPGELTPSFPTVLLGPKTVGTTQNLFEFKQPSPPGPDASDPPGTTTAWPVDNWFDDIYAAFMDTLRLPGTRLESAGSYQIKLEVFGPAGNLLSAVDPPGPAVPPFKFIVPSSVDPDGTVHTRLATAAELDGGGFVFTLQIDNNPCDAEIHLTNIGGVAVADACGFLRYTPGVGTVTLSFTAKHPNNHARFSFNLVRGATPVVAANASGEVGDSPVGPYTRDASSKFSNDFTQSTLLDTCHNAAFAESLHVYAKATNGSDRLSGYDDSALIAFALAEQT